MKYLGLIILVFLFSCATHLTTTKIISLQSEDTKVLSRRNFVFTIKRNNPVISGQHHEGLLQVPQPWIFGLSDEQKEQLRNSAADLAADKLIDELRKGGVKILEANSKSQNYELWTIEVTQVQIDTYGDGYRGFGSAGNYWKANNFYKITHVGDRSQDFTLQKEAVATPCPVDMNASTILNLFEFAIKPNVLSLPKASYDVNLTSETPVEISARLAARDLISILIAN